MTYLPQMMTHQQYLIRLYCVAKEREILHNKVFRMIADYCCVALIISSLDSIYLYTRARFQFCANPLKFFVVISHIRDIDGKSRATLIAKARETIKLLFYHKR